jgi:hypothetical protein
MKMIDYGWFYVLKTRTWLTELIWSIETDDQRKNYGVLKNMFLDLICINQGLQVTKLR